MPKRGRKGKKKSLDEILQEALENAPTIQGYTIKQLSEITGIPWTTTRWHLERLEAKGLVEPYEIGRAKIYRLKKRKKD